MVPNFTLGIRMTAGEDFLTSEYQLINKPLLLPKFFIKLLHSTNQQSRTNRDIQVSLHKISEQLINFIRNIENQIIKLKD